MDGDELRALQAPLKDRYRETPGAVGFTAIRLTFDLDTDASGEELDKVIATTERYCVVFQTLAHSPAVSKQRAS
jgi:uncharacterized OsmC-like protein